MVLKVQKYERHRPSLNVRIHVFAAAMWLRSARRGSWPGCLRSCRSDGGTDPPDLPKAGAGSKPPRAALAEDRGRERRGKRASPRGESGVNREGE